MILKSNIHGHEACLISEFSVSITCIVALY